MATMSPLRRRMIDDMMVRNLAGDAAILHLRGQKIQRVFQPVAGQARDEDVRTYQPHLIAQQRSWSHINQVSCALRFFFGVTLAESDAKRTLNPRQAGQQSDDCGQLVRAG